jgi:hypothetical protein
VNESDSSLLEDPFRDDGQDEQTHVNEDVDAVDNVRRDFFLVYEYVQGQR